MTRVVTTFQFDVNVFSLLCVRESSTNINVSGCKVETVLAHMGVIGIHLARTKLLQNKFS